MCSVLSRVVQEDVFEVTAVELGVLQKLRIRHDSSHQTNVISEGPWAGYETSEQRTGGIISFNDLLSVSSYGKSGRRWTILSSQE